MLRKRWNSELFWRKGQSEAPLWRPGWFVGKYRPEQAGPLNFEVDNGVPRAKGHVMPGIVADREEGHPLLVGLN